MGLVEILFWAFIACCSLTTIILFVRVITPNAKAMQEDNDDIYNQEINDRARDSDQMLFM